MISNSQPQTPRIDSVVMLSVQPHEDDPNVIWYDDFDGPPKKYGEGSIRIEQEETFGGTGQSFEHFYDKGSRGSGGCKVFFGDSPTGSPVIQKGKRFEDVYWRVYVKHQYGWTGGGPDKLSRATSMVSSNWAQAMIAHVWSSGQSLTLDPASGVRGANIVTTKYNDFDNLRWLGNKPVSNFKIHSTEEAGWWVCVESRAKINSPGQRDGSNQLWLDGRLEAERKNLDWMGSYTKHAINAVFLEAYWNNGSPVAQYRWLDNYVISSAPIGPVVCSRNPTYIKTPYRDDGSSGGWELELTDDEDNGVVVWKSNIITNSLQVEVNSETGDFFEDLSNQNKLASSTAYFARVREKDSNGDWSSWSHWHQPIKTEDTPTRINMWNQIK